MPSNLRPVTAHGLLAAAARTARGPAGEGLAAVAAS
ncbi:hypothetical protein FHR32_005276 [Streptosporangium album]|uniref:Uncharacterized protein n=1 Tax=Streptosporangium album TaxID=47479 RepID=A0A7W7RZ19_9ACTN|nr:hypothetical protein [Streptosporangium album]